MEEKKERCPNDICPGCGHYCDCVEGDISVRCECICSGEPDEERELTIPISEMFDFISWKDSQRLMYDNIINQWYSFEVSQWILIGSNSDLWNKYQEYKQKVKKEANE